MYNWDALSIHEVVRSSTEWRVRHQQLLVACELGTHGVRRDS